MHEASWSLVLLLLVVESVFLFAARQAREGAGAAGPNGAGARGAAEGSGGAGLKPPSPPLSVPVARYPTTPTRAVLLIMM